MNARRMYYNFGMALVEFLFVLFLILTLVGFAFAECYYTSPDLAPTQSQAKARAKAYMRKHYGAEFSPQCELGVRDGQSVWLCEDEPGLCRKQEWQNGLVNRMFRQQQSERPSWDGYYEAPNGEQYRCDRAFGCRKRF